VSTNIFKINIEFDEYEIARIPYSDEELTGLRKKYNSTHSFFRNREFIYVSNKEGDESLSFGETCRLKTYDESEITSSLLKHIFFRTFKERFQSIIPLDFYPFRIYSTQQKDDLMVDLLPDGLKGKLCYKKLIELQLRLFRPDHNPFFAFIINIDRNWTLSKTCLEIYREGFDLIGKEVLHSIPLPGLQNVLAPDEELIGVVISISENNAEIQTNFGIKKYPLAELFLRRSLVNLQDYVAHFTTEETSTKIFENLKLKRTEYLSAKTNYEEIIKVADLFATTQNEEGVKAPYLYMNKDGFCFTISNTPLVFQNKFQLKTPTFIFDYANNKTENSNPDRGLNNYGPFDSYSFDAKQPNIIGICHKNNRGHFTRFLSSLIEGLPNSKYFKNGFKKKYDLRDINLKVMELSNYSNVEIDKILTLSIDKPNLVIIEIPSKFRKLKDVENPYYLIKAKFLSLEIPVQFVLTDKVMSYDEYILNTIGLQIYAKLGGTPWVLPTSRSVDRELIIGIGHTSIRNNSYKGNEQNRVVGISTFFSSDGQYILSNKANDVAYENYFGELLNNLNDSFEKLRAEQAWKDGDTIRLIFHIFKPIKNIEFEVICKLIEKYSQFRIQFAFVTISKTHPYKIYDLQQIGEGKFKKGIYLPIRGANLFIDESSCVVQMLGARELKTSKHGSSSPILIRLRLPQGEQNKVISENMLFTDLSYIVQQIYSFTYLSWRSFLPAEQPATMLYSNLIAEVLGKLRKIESWNPSVLNFSLKRKKWFL